MNAQFCHSCGSPIAVATTPAEFKQVTVLFADVVHSMDLAAAVGAERLREIMGALFGRCAAVVRRYDGVVEKFIGDAVMAVFGVPVALEDHALRACLAALDIQQQAQQLAAEVARVDGVSLELRVGLNSGQVVAGDLGSDPLSYTAIGEQVGLAQRMESVAPPGGVVLSQSTVRLVEDVAVLGEPVVVQFKGAGAQVPVCRLLAVSPERRHVPRQDPTLVGRAWEMAALKGILDESIAGTGCIVGVAGPPGIGKSRIVREVGVLARSHGVEVFAAYCESHAREIPLYAATSLLRSALGIDNLDDESARARIEEHAPGADPEDLLLLEDLLGVRGTGIELPAIDPDARRRRVTRLVNAMSLARTTPAVYVIEDAHWIDEVSDVLLADLLLVTRQTPSLVLVTYRPEYHGALARTVSSQAITLGPLNASQTAMLAAELIGPDPSTAGLCRRVVERAAGNPLFAEEMVRDLAERAVLTGSRGRYVCAVDDAELVVPATVQATIASRIDRLDPVVKRTLQAAAVIGLRFDSEQLALLDDVAQIEPLLEAELIDQVRIAPHAEYAFHHPLVRIVAYESQLKSQRAMLHRRLAAAIEQHHPGALDENAAMIAEHLEAAEDLPAAFGWHMRAGAWARDLDIRAARVSWDCARVVADRLPMNDPDRIPMRIAPRTLLCGSAWRVGGSSSDTGFDELRELCTASGDQVSLAVGMAGLLTAMAFNSRYQEVPQLTAQLVDLLETIGDPDLSVGLLFAALWAKLEPGDAVEGWGLAQRLIDLAEGDPEKGNLLLGSPLTAAIAVRGAFGMLRGCPGWGDDLDEAVEMARACDPTTRAVTVMFQCLLIPQGAILPDATMRNSADLLEVAEQSGDEFALAAARLARGIALAHHPDSDRDQGAELLTLAREAALNQRFIASLAQVADTQIALQMAQTGDLDGAIDLLRKVVRTLLEDGVLIWYVPAAVGLVQRLLDRASPGDCHEAEAILDRFAEAAKVAELGLHEAWLLRGQALLARARGDDATYRECVDRYRAKAQTCGYAGHLAMAEAMR
ncbi:ATP-binding protein [[Mycobacterium] vasticus]|uniref:Adenylate/guanylate cyclase domain-containing protein n=1 Tax=[Mycobacterium] vasticus TaxID=2875777 RepID=A0ABU5YU57_9MYCO|nr:adenylate/guanylate cyclase domain-containing protein [Mycolicibacter sp. MYC017]MEB3068657.1 adenylate/guanylate cyclase domain-containing protein [Mycolicibacter sp. MYC017]